MTLLLNDSESPSCGSTPCPGDSFALHTRQGTGDTVAHRRIFRLLLPEPTAEQSSTNRVKEAV